jgi:hypothetical protein
VDFVAISEGLIGDPLLIGLFLCGSSVIMELLEYRVVRGAGGAGNKKTPQPAGSSRGCA